MNELEQVSAHCPYCGEPIELTVDCTVQQQRYVEDCEVCCMPIEVALEVGVDGVPAVTLQRQDEV
jgi:hypothetical protein